MYLEKIIEELNAQPTHNMVNSTYGYDHMVYVRLFEGCNLHCEHCFIPSNPKKIESTFYENKGLTEELMRFAKVKTGQRLYLQWHGGEPTLLGVNYLKQAILNIQADNRFQYMHGIQTNLMNFDKDTEKWVQLYKEHFDAQIGISWDYAIRHTRAQTQSPEQTNITFEEKFWSNVHLAQSHGLELYMVITATKVFFERYKNPFEFFDFIVEKGITKLNFERITKTGYARESWQRLGLSNKEYSTYMSKFFKAYYMFKRNNPEINLHISPFDGLLRSVIGLELQTHQSNQADIWDIMSYKNQGYGCWSGTCDTRFHTIDSNGYKHGCTALTSEQDNKKVSTEQVQKIMWIGRKNAAAEQELAILNQRSKRQETCQGCEFLSICSSGCLSVEKFDDSGECSGAKSLFNTISEQVKKEMLIRI